MTSHQGGPQGTLGRGAGPPHPYTELWLPAGPLGSHGLPGMLWGWVCPQTPREFPLTLTLLRCVGPTGALAMQSCEEQRLNNHASWAKLPSGSNPSAIWLSQGRIGPAEKEKLLLVPPCTQLTLCDRPGEQPAMPALASLEGSCAQKKDPIQATKNICKQINQDPRHPSLASDPIVRQ